MEDVATPIDALLTSDVATITPDETVTAASRRMESQTARSLIVVESDRPVGVVQWRGLSQLDPNAPVREVMQTEFPVIRSGASLEEARQRLTGLDVDIDRVPVVDDNGTLIGEVPRSAVVKSESMTSGATEPVVSGPDAMRNEPTITLEKGMTVMGPSGHKLGTVDAVELNSEGNIAHFLVKHGLIGKHNKRLPADVIDNVSGDTVTLNIDSTEFKMLADLDS